MLTESEKQWIAWKRHIKSIEHGAGAWCQYQNCPHLGRNAAGCYGEPYCPLFPDWQDAAEFEARVAKRLATDRGWWTPCIETHNCAEPAQFPSKFGIENWGKCDWCKLKWTRLMVEEEMDADLDN